MFRIVVTELTDHAVGSPEKDIPRFDQTIDTLDFHKLAVLVNPPPKRVYKRKEAKT